MSCFNLRWIGIPCISWQLKSALFDQPCLFIEGVIRMRGNEGINYIVKHFLGEVNVIQYMHLK